MKNNAQHIDHLRRLRVLQALERVAPDPIGQGLILQVVQADAELTPTIKRVQRSLNYLADNGLVDLITVEDTDWMAATITNVGKTFLASNDADSQLAIYHPGEKPELVSSNYNGRVSSIGTLPPEVKAWLDQEMIRRNFSGYKQLAALLSERGYEISKSAVGRYGKRFKEEQKQLKETIGMARAISEAYGDDGADMNTAITALMQQEVIAIIRDKKYSADIKLPQLINGVAQLNKSNLATIKFQIEQKARKKAFEDAATIVEEVAVAQGMDDEQVLMWRGKVLRGL